MNEEGRQGIGPTKLDTVEDETRNRTAIDAFEGLDHLGTIGPRLVAATFVDALEEEFGDFADEVDAAALPRPLGPELRVDAIQVCAPSREVAGAKLELGVAPGPHPWAAG